MEDQNKSVVTETRIEEAPKKKNTFITFKQILLIILVIFIIIFMMLNFTEVDVNLLFAKIQAPLVVVIFLSYILGSVITWLMHALKKDKE